jgi:type IV secretory pathway protease TraF
MRISSIAVAILFATQGVLAPNATAAEPATKTVASLNKDKVSLAGKTIKVQGKVVKVNNGIMGRNFVHVQDGTGDPKSNTNNLIVTSKQTAQIGDSVTVSGVVALNRDFGSGYSYPLLIEDATIVARK